MRKSFFSKYDLESLGDSFYSPSVMDTENNVDRLTYMDPTAQIEQLKRFGRQTTMIASQALYHSYDDVEAVRASTPVYSVDPVDMQHMIKYYQNVQKDNTSASEEQNVTEI